MNGSPLSLTLSPMRLELTRAEDSDHAGGGGYGFGLSVDDGKGRWRPITAADNPFVRGSCFDLRPTDLVHLSDARVQLHGARGEYEFDVTVSSDATRGWFKFEVDLELPRPLELSMTGGPEPEVLLDMGPLPPYERGDHVWFMTNIANPTKWNDDAHGNDMPATYLFDAYKRAEVMMFFDMTAMDWMSLANTGRFLNYRCGYKRRYRPAAAASLGLYLDDYSGKSIREGKCRFVYYISAAPRGQAPTDQDAVRTLVERCLPLLPAKSEWPSRATDWRRFARGCADELMSDHVWHSRAGIAGEFMLNYVDAHSPAWQECIEARGNTFDMDKPCLESAVWGAHPLSVLCRIDSDPLYQTLTQRMLGFISRMVETGKTPLSNDDAAGARGVWQHLYIVEQMLQVALLQQDRPLIARIRNEVDTVLIPLAQKMQYMFPLSFDKPTLTKQGSGDAHSVLGIYASLMLDLYERTADPAYLEEAKRATRVHHQLPVNTVHQEVFMLAMGVHAAARLAAREEDAPEFAGIARYLQAQTLRMMHWFDDRTEGDDTVVHTLGMFQACATINYPAIFENIETLARLAAAMNVLPPDASLLRVFDHARKNNFYFFPACLPGADSMPLKFVPLENIGILEGPRPASVGAEVYGAGWVFRAYLLWEAFGRCADREIMVLNCNAFDERRQLESGRWELNFYVFNPTAEPREAELIFPVAVERPATLISGGERHRLSIGRWTTQLAPGEARRIHVLVD